MLVCSMFASVSCCLESVRGLRDVHAGVLLALQWPASLSAPQVASCLSVYQIRHDVSSEIGKPVRHVKSELSRLDRCDVTKRAVN
jgi:hypothetical protein